MTDPDFALLCAIRERPLDGPAVWARLSGMDASAARRRIAKLEATGALRGFSAIPDAAVFDRTYTPHQFDAPDGCDEDAILAVPDVAWFARTLQGNLYVITYEDGTPRRAELEALLGPNIGTFAHADQAQRDPSAILGRISLKVLRELILDPRATIQQLTERTGLGAKTVRNHRAELLAKRHVTIDPLLRTPNVPGRLFYNLAVEVDDNQHRQAVADAVPDAVLVNHFDEPPVAYMFATAAGLIEQGQHLQAIGRIPHVADVRLIVNQEYGVATERLVGWCDEAIAAWSR
ncbi:MAG: winged helix-turn-helix transcriptional regulator [Thermoplasmatota archaeon]